MPGPLLGVTYSEFDNKVGSQLKYAYPTDAMSKELFEAFSDYVIVASQLCEKSIIVTLDDTVFLNYSVAIDNPKYERNALLFSFGCILAEGADTAPYETVLQKVSSTFVNLEVESEYLFQPESKAKVQEFLRTLYYDLTHHNESCIKLDNANYFAVKLFKSPVQNMVIRDYDVPVFRQPCPNSATQVLGTCQPHQQHTQVDLSVLPWDISFQHLLPFIDGKSSVKRIIKQVDMDGEYVRRSLALLLFHECIMLTDIFKFSNVYQLINSEHSLQQLASPHILNELREYSALDSTLKAVSSGGGGGESKVKGFDRDASLPTNNQMINFVFKMQNNKSVQQIIVDSFEAPVPTGTTFGAARGGSSSALSLASILNSDNALNKRAEALQESNPAQMPFHNMDIARFVAYLQFRGIIRRVHEYPVYSPPAEQPAVTPSDKAPPAPEPFKKADRRRLSFGGVSSDHAPPASRRLQPGEGYHIGGDVDSAAPVGDSGAPADEPRLRPAYRNVKSMINLDVHDTAAGSAVRRVASVAAAAGTGEHELPIGLGLSPAEPTVLPVSAPADAPAVTTTAAVGGGLPSSDSSGNFQKLVARSKVVVGRAYLTDAGVTSSSAKVSLESIATSLVGKLHMDHICTEFHVSYQDIATFPGITLVYK